MAKRYYWLKLQADFFESLRVKKLRRLAGGDTFVIIYLKMQLIAMQNDGYIKYTGLENSFAEELALDLDEDVENVALTLQYLSSTGLIETSDNINFFLPYSVENVGSESASAQRVRECRAQKVLQCNTDVTKCNKTVTERKRKRKEIEIENRDRVDYKQIIDLYNDTCVSFPQVKSLSEKRKQSIRARLTEYSIEKFLMMFQKAEASSFLKGKNNRDWQANFDWLIRDSNFAKVLDGNYDDKQTKQIENTKQTSYDLTKAKSNDFENINW